MTNLNKYMLWFALSLIFIGFGYFWHFKAIGDAIGDEPAFVGKVCADEIERAIHKMGPRYDYKMVGERLYVNRGDGKWLRLRYERRD